MHLTVQPPSLRIQRPSSVTCKESKREDHADDREQLKHVRTSVIQRPSFDAVSRPKFDIAEN